MSKDKHAASDEDSGVPSCHEGPVCMNDRRIRMLERENQENRNNISAVNLDLVRLSKDLEAFGKTVRDVTDSMRETRTQVRESRKMHPLVAKALEQAVTIAVTIVIGAFLWLIVASGQVPGASIITGAKQPMPVKDTNP